MGEDQTTTDAGTSDEDRQVEEEMRRVEEDPPKSLDDWPGGKAKYKTFGGAESESGYGEGVTEKLARIDDYRREYGTVGNRFDVYATTMESFSADGIKRLEDLGVTHTSGGFSSFNPYGAEADSETLQQKIDALNRYADEVISRVR